jgi:BCD family chlorophyll transporter-like MFS transporter
MLVVGMALSALIYGLLLSNFSQLTLIKVIQGSAVVVFALNITALWKQEVRDPKVTDTKLERPTFANAWQSLTQDATARRFLLALGVGTLAFGMQDILLEPYGAERLVMTVSETTRLTAIYAFGTLIGFGIAARSLSAGFEPHRLAACGVLVGILAFSLVIFAEPLASTAVFQAGTFMIGSGSGLFSVCMLTSAMALASANESGIALGAWGAVSATAAGIALAVGGILKDAAEWVVGMGWLGDSLDHEAFGYSFVYHIEILFLFATLAVLGPIASLSRKAFNPKEDRKFGLAVFPE